MSEVKAALRLTLITGGLAEVQAATRAVKALAAAGQAGTRASAGSAGAAIRAAEGVSSAKIRGLRSVEAEMVRLTNLDKQRENTAEARKALGKSSGSFLTGHGFADKSRQVVGAIRDLTVAGMGVRFAFGGAAAAIHSVMDPAREFGATMAEVRNKGSFSAAQTAEIAAMAKAMGRTTQFSPQDAGKAAVELAAAGLGGSDIKKALPSTLKFAQAGGLGTEQSTAVLVETMSQFGMHATDFEHIGDTLVKAANMSTISVADMAESLKYAGPVARAAGQSLEFTAGTIALLGENGLKGSMGGTALRKMMDSLVHASKTAKPALAALGLTPKDLQKGLSDMPAFFELLSKKMNAKHMNTAQRLEVSKLLFGEEGMAASQILMVKALDHGANGWRAYTEQVANANGAMQTAADITGDTLDGKLKKLDASLETAKITLGEAFVPALTKMVPKMAEAANAAGNWAQKNQALIPQLVEMGGGAALSLLGVKMAASLGGAAQLLAPAATLAGASFSSAFAAAFVAGIAAYGLTTAILAAMHIDMGQIGADLFDFIHGTKDDMSRNRSVSSAIAAKKNEKANVRDAGYVPMSKQNDFALDLAGSAAHLPLNGQIDVTVTDDRVKVKTRSNSVPLRTGSNAGAR